MLRTIAIFSVASITAILLMGSVNNKINSEINKSTLCTAKFLVIGSDGNSVSGYTRVVNPEQIHV